MERIRRNLILKTLLSGLERFASFSHFTAGAHQAFDLPVWINGSIQFSKRLSPFSHRAAHLIVRGSRTCSAGREKKNRLLTS